MLPDRARVRPDTGNLRRCGVHLVLVLCFLQKLSQTWNFDISRYKNKVPDLAVREILGRQEEVPQNLGLLLKSCSPSRG